MATLFQSVFGNTDDIEFSEDDANTEEVAKYIKIPTSPLWTEFEFVAPLQGPVGPTLDECYIIYKARYPWTQLNINFSMVRNGYQLLVIPTTGRYELIAYGAGTDRSYGAIVSGEFHLKEGDIIEVAVGQQHKDASIYRKDYTTKHITPVSNNEVHSGCGGTSVSHGVCKGYVSNNDDRSVVTNLLMVAGGAGYGPDAEHSYASLTEYAKGNRIKRSGGISIRPDTATAGAGYVNNIHDVLGKSNSDNIHNPKSYECGLVGGYGNYDWSDK